MPRCVVQFLTVLTGVQTCVGDCNRAVYGSFLVAKTLRPHLGTNQFGWVPGHLTFPSVKRPVRVAGHLHRMLKFRISGAIPSRSLCAFMMCIGKTLLFTPFAVCVNFLYTFRLLFDICVVVLVMFLRPVILRILSNFEWLWRLYLGSCTFWLPQKFEMTVSLLSEVYIQWTAVLWR